MRYDDDEIMDNLDDNFIDETPALSPLDPIDFDRESKIELVNNGYFMQHRSEPYLLNNPKDFADFFKFLVASYMDYCHYADVIDDVYSDMIDTIKYANPNLFADIKSGKTDYIDYREAHQSFVLDAGDLLMSAHGNLSSYASTARTQLENLLVILFDSDSSIQQFVLGQSYRVPLQKKKSIIHSLTNNILDLGVAYNMEQNTEKFVAHINSVMPELIDKDIIIVQRPKAEPFRGEKLTFKPRYTDYDLSDPNDFKELFILVAGTYFDQLDYWLAIDDVLDRFDETLEYTDAATYASIYILDDCEGNPAAEVLSDLREAEINLSKEVELYERLLKKALERLFQSPKEIQEHVLGNVFQIPVPEMPGLLQSIFDTITDVERDYVMETSKDNFLKYVYEKLQAFIV